MRDKIYACVHDGVEGSVNISLIIFDGGHEIPHQVAIRDIIDDLF